MLDNIFTFYRSFHSSFSDEEQEKVKKLFKKKNCSVKRLKEIGLSRQALLDGLLSFGITALENQLNIINYHYLENFPDYIVSITHNPHVCMVALARRSDFFSIGIDIEEFDRKITSGAEKFFLNPRDDLNRTPLELWVMKEAAYKAIYPFASLKGIQSNLTLKNIWIGVNDLFGIDSNDESLGFVNLERTNLESKEHLLAKSYVPLQQF